MLGGVIFLLVLLIVAGIIYVIVFYAMGREAASYSWGGYDNRYSGLTAVLYDMGYDSWEASRNRAKANLKAHMARREARAQREDVG